MIDAPTLMLVGTVIQAAMPARQFIVDWRWRRSTRDAVASLPFVPLARPNSELDALVELADAALAARH